MCLNIDSLKVLANFLLCLSVECYDTKMSMIIFYWIEFSENGNLP